MANLNSFEDLDCWRVATELRRELSQVIKGFPAEEKFELVSQIRRASRSVTNNIAEGFGRYHYQEFIHFCRISRGSLSELKDHLIIECDENYISESRSTDLRNKIERSQALVNGFINYLERKKAGNIFGTKEPEMEYYSIESHSDDSTTNNG